MGSSVRQYEVILTLHDETIGTPSQLQALDRSPIATRQAIEFAATDGTEPTVLNVQHR